MKKNNLFRLLVLLLSIFVISFFYTLIDTGFSDISAYEAGKAVGHTMKYFFKILGTLALIVLMLRLFKSYFYGEK